MQADWLHQLQLVGGRSLTSAMFQGAEAYLEMWEHAYGVPPASCRAASESFTSTGLGKRLSLGDDTVAALYRGGQPASRPGRTYRYCVARRAARQAVTAVFTARGRIAMIASTAPGDRATGVGTGSPVARLGRAARQFSPRIRVVSARGSHTAHVYGVGGGRVTYVAVTRSAELRDPAQLRSDLNAAGLAY